MELSEVAGHDVPRETLEKLEAYLGLLKSAAATQNLVSQASLEDVWNRHIIDCAQLLRHGRGRRWVDIGSGAGLPGIVLAILSGNPIALIEPRRLRVEFLQRAVDELELTNATVIQGKAGAIHGAFDTITARAVASTTALFDFAHHLTRSDTVWVLPKGRSAQKELDEARATWQGEFRLEPSLTDADASILVAMRVRRRGR